MSLSELATEFHVNIIERLDDRNLNNLSLVSNYWRNITEEYLYKDIKIDQYGRLRCLLKTLLAREELIRHVRSFSFQAREGDPGPKLCKMSPKQNGRIRSLTALIRRSIKQHVNRIRYMQYAPHWDTSDKCLTLILHLTTNLQELNLDFAEDSFDRFKITRLILGYDWRSAPENQGSPLFFQKLESFSLGVEKFNRDFQPPALRKLNSIIPISDSLRNVSVKRLFFRGLDDWLHPNLGITLNTLTIYNTRTDIDEIRRVIRRSCLQNLRRLSISRIPPLRTTKGYGELPMGRNSPRLISPNYGNRSNGMTSAIVKHLPGLEELEMSNVGHVRGTQPSPGQKFSLGGHTNLVKLIIDYELMIGYRLPKEEISMLNSDQSPPPNLRSLELTNVKSWFRTRYQRMTHLDDFLGLYEKYAEQPIFYTTLMEAFFKIKNIKEFSFHVDFVEVYIRSERKFVEEIDEEIPRYSKRTEHDCFRELSERGEDTIRRLVEHLQREGVEMKVWRQECKYPKKLLYAPGYESGEPIWSESEVIREFKQWGIEELR